MCSVLNEWMAGILNMRTRNLWEGVRNLLYDSEGTGLAKQLYDHALVKNLGKSGTLPPWVPSRAFALALFDLVAPVNDSTTTRTLQDIRSSVVTISNEQVKNPALPSGASWQIFVKPPCAMLILVSTLRSQILACYNPAPDA